MMAVHHGSGRPAVSAPRCPTRAWTALACAVALALAPVAARAQAAASGATLTLPAPNAAAPAPESLTALLQRVLPAEPQVRSAQALLEVAHERRIQARSRLLPTLGVQAVQGRSNEQELGFSVDRRTSRAETTLRWNLYNSGNDGAEWRATEIDADAAEQELRRAQEDACERIAEAYLEVLRLQTVLPRSTDRLQAVQRLVEQTRRQADLGKMSEADAQQAEASLLDAEIAHEEATADHDSARRKLARLVGATALDEVHPALPVVLPAPAAGAQSDAISALPPGALAAAQQRARAARERVRPQMSLLAPRIDLELRKQLGDSTAPALTTQNRNAWQITARWDFPVGGELQSRRNETERRAEASAAEAERILRNLQAEMSTLAPQVAQAERALDKLVRQIEQYNTLVRAGELQFEAGRRTLAQLITLRDSRYNAEKRLAEQVTRLQKARLTQLYYSGELLPAMGVAPMPRAPELRSPGDTVPPPFNDSTPGG